MEICFLLLWGATITIPKTVFIQRLNKDETPVRFLLKVNADCFKYICNVVWKESSRCKCGYQWVFLCSMLATTSLFTFPIHIVNLYKDLTTFKAWNCACQHVSSQNFYLLPAQGPNSKAKSNSFRVCKSLGLFLGKATFRLSSDTRLDANTKQFVTEIKKLKPQTPP